MLYDSLFSFRLQLTVVTPLGLSLVPAVALVVQDNKREREAVLILPRKMVVKTALNVDRVKMSGSVRLILVQVRYNFVGNFKTVCSR